MQALKFETKLDENASLHLSRLPWKPGIDVEVIVLHREKENALDRYPLRGEPVELEDPTEPVALEDWEALG